MRLRKRSLPASCWLALPLIPFCCARTPEAVSLPQFQPISGFSDACTRAYNSLIPGCTPSDFNQNGPCSADCINGLQVISALINSACQGTVADPTTLIQLFLEGKGVVALCPNAALPSSSIPTGGSPSTSDSVNGDRTSTTPTISTTTDHLTDTTSAFSTTDMSLTTTPVVAATESTGSTARAVSTTTISSSSPSSSIPTTVASAAASSTSTNTAPTFEPGFPKTVADAGSAAVITSKAEQSSSRNPDAFGGGGSPFEISRAAQLPSEALLYTLSTILCFLVILRFDWI